MHRQIVAALDGDVQADAMDRRFDFVAERRALGDVQRRRHQHAQRQPVPDHDLFDVEQLNLVPRKNFEQRRRHAWLVVTGDGDQRRHLAGCTHPKLPPLEAITCER